MGVAVAIAFAVAAVGSEVMAAKKANRAAEYSNKSQMAKALLAQVANERRANIATEQARVASASSEAAAKAAIGSGSGSSSSAIGSVQSIKNQLNAHLQYLDESQALTDKANQYARQSANEQRVAGEFNALGSVFGTAASFAMGSAEAAPASSSTIPVSQAKSVFQPVPSPYYQSGVLVG